MQNVRRTFAMTALSLGDLSLYYDDCGNGEPLLLIGGLGSDSSSWMSVFEELSRRFRTIAFDNRGCGRSGTPREPYAIHDMANDAIGLLDVLGIRRAHIIGHSMGGFIAQEIAIQHPHRIDKLVLASTSLASSARNNALFDDFSRQLEKDSDYGAWVGRWTSWLFSQKTLARPDFVRAFVQNAVAYPYRQSAEGFRGQVRALASFDAREGAKAIRAKTLVLEGGEDILVTTAEAKALAESVPESIYRVMKGTGHSLHIECPELFVEDVLEFLRR